MSVFGPGTGVSGAGAELSNSAPAALGTAASPGAASTAARGDHVHPRPTLAQLSNDAGFITSAGAPVQSVAGRTGTVALAVADVAGAAPLASPSFAGPLQTGGVNLARMAGGATGAAPVVFGAGAASLGSDVGVVLAPKGTGPLTASEPDNTPAGGNARGVNAVDWQTLRLAAGQVAAGPCAVIGGGYANTGPGGFSVVAGGSQNSAGGDYAWIPGGYGGTTRGFYGRGAWAGGFFSTLGDAQASEAVLRRLTTDATSIILTADGGAPGPLTLVNLPNNCTASGRLHVVARQIGGLAGAAGDSAHWVRDVIMKRGASAAAFVMINPGSATPIGPTANDTGAAAWRIFFSGDTVNGGMAVSVIGEANKTINWVARFMSVEVVG